MRTSKTKHLALTNQPENLILFVPQPRMTLSQYAQMTGQTLRQVQQQADKGRFILAEGKYGKEREINMVAEYMREQVAAAEALKRLV
ncbi:hypothetical protein [Klebsiella oxytoca]|uniref:hypothetical protein n=1 Tax=Klebsiella oxytoca TaxID=571 RepID=UPI001B95641E|nr:hypothetical protein [Klebsiella oxytoca]EJM1004371.1 hypothetical protein [Klebsiella oxytoca]EKQ7240003.1 hypothetical protein [Klebsiella oxytoca]WBD79890.1 hypothetical protein OEE41_12970 [Klebsiella oxytoca]HBC8618099.1 hypothetical protein [Klebsiella oxytoca]